MSRSTVTDGSPASILATRDWLDPSFLAWLSTSAVCLAVALRRHLRRDIPG